MPSPWARYSVPIMKHTRTHTNTGSVHSSPHRQTDQITRFLHLAALWFFFWFFFTCSDGTKAFMCILKLSFQSWQYISQAGHSNPLPPAPSSLASQAPITTAERHQQAITARWESDTFHKSLSWEIAFLYPAWDCVWGKNTTVPTHKTKAPTCLHMFVTSAHIYTLHTQGYWTRYTVKTHAQVCAPKGQTAWAVLCN